MRKADIAAEILRRQRARESLHAFALSVPIPTVPNDPLYIDERIMGPSSLYMPLHLDKIYGVIERTMNTHMGRAMLFLPPGVAKSLATVTGVSWEMGRKPGTQIIYTSYNDDLAETQSARVMQICDEPDYKGIFLEAPEVRARAVSKWDMDNESSLRAAGLLSGITGRRANGFVIDDPVKNQEDADSVVQRDKVYKEFNSTVKTRLLPGAWVILMMTRWHEDDLAGRILPDDYKGESGYIRCKDGLDWLVLNVQAKCERPDDPLGRKIGEYIWPEYYPKEHWLQFELALGHEAARTWESLCQQRPTPQGSGRFTKEMFRYYDGAEELPPRLALISASDHAVTEGGGDFSECGVWGMDTSGNLYMLYWWNGQVDPDKSADEVLDMVERYKHAMHFNEGGNIDKVMRPLFNIKIRERHRKGRRCYVDIRALPKQADKVAKVASFQGRCASGMVYFPKRNPHTARIINQLIAMPAGKYDDAADVCGLIGRALDEFHPVETRPVQRKESIKPFTAEWLEHSEEPEKAPVRYR